MTTATATSITEIKTTASFEDFNLHPKLLQAIRACSYTTPTEIQVKAIPSVLRNRDLIASAETGSGKTVAFVLPALQRLLNEPPVSKGRGPRVLILTPTRELATQITSAIGDLNKFTNFKFGTIIGQVPYYAQERLLREPLDLLVATPGRLMDHMNRGRVDFSRLELFILDEADRMLDMGFVENMEDIASALPEKHQTLLFSATIDENIQRIARKFLTNPERIELTSAKKKHALISQRIHLVDNFTHKRALLAHVLEEPGMWQAIVFMATKRGADELVEDLCQQGIHCAALHGDMKQSKRTRTLEQMHRGKLRVLIATDVAARGIDIKKLTHVINFDLPRTPADYVHRIGRAGRCGEKGFAISLVGSKERALLAQIERFTGQKLIPEIVAGFEPKLTFKSAASPSEQRSQGSSNRRRGSYSSPHSGSGERGHSGRSASPRRFEGSRNRREESNTREFSSRQFEGPRNRTEGSSTRESSPRRFEGSRDRTEASTRESSPRRFEGSRNRREESNTRESSPRRFEGSRNRTEGSSTRESSPRRFEGSRNRREESETRGPSFSNRRFTDQRKSNPVESRSRPFSAKPGQRNERNENARNPAKRAERPNKQSADTKKPGSRPVKFKNPRSKITAAV